MNKWFEKVFLPSLFERAKNKPLWLSQRQAAICIDNFSDCKTVNYEGTNGTNYRRLVYSHTWQNRTVTLYYSKLNGCGQIVFGYTPEEEEQFKVEVEKENQNNHFERLEHLKKRALVDKDPKALERYNRRIAKLQAELTEWKEELQEDIKENLLDNIVIDKQQIAEIGSDLNFLLNTEV